MFRRFAAATAASAAVSGVGIMVLLAVPGIDLPRFQPVLALWCVLPLVWGVWAIFAPQTWVPGRLPWWGAILGLIAGVFAVFVLNLPARVFGLSLSPPARFVPLAMITLFYYLLWHLVRVAWLALDDHNQ